MKISYAVTVCNEYKEVEKLLSFLFELGALISCI